MKLSKEEKAARKAAFRTMSPAQKLDHILTYYKWPILLGLIAAVILCSALHRHFTRKEPVLYLALANVAAGSELETELTEGFLRFSGADGRKQEVYLLRELYLSEDADVVNHEYAYASRMKLMGAIQAQRLDAVIMNREACELLSAGGYLLDLEALLSGTDPELYAQAARLLAANAVITEDNGIDWQLGEAEEHLVVTETVPNALALEGLPLYRAAGFEEPLYFGVIANSPRQAAAVQYLRYLLEENG